VIDRPALIAWRSRAPWPNPVQIEQDLLLSRLMIEIARDEVLGPELAMRGGTCLHKLHLPTPLRYSAALRVKHPLYRGTPRPAMSPDHRPIPLAGEPVTVHAAGPGWHGQTLRWPDGIGHFFLAGEVALNASQEEIVVQILFTDEQDVELFYFNLVPRVVRTRFGYFCLPREGARIVPQTESKHDLAWSSICKMVVRCASDNEGSATVTNLRAFAEPASRPPR
jgi:hypothetical protein